MTSYNASGKTSGPHGTSAAWTQEDLAGHSGLAVVQISRVERGVREIRLTTLLRLVRALEKSPADLLDGLY